MTFIEDEIVLFVPPDVALKLGVTRLFVKIGESKNYEQVLQSLNSVDPFFNDILSGKGSTEEGPFILVLNKRILTYEKLINTKVNSKDEILFIPPILGG